MHWTKNPLLLVRSFTIVRWQAKSVSFHRFNLSIWTNINEWIWILEIHWGIDYRNRRFLSETLNYEYIKKLKMLNCADENVRIESFRAYRNTGIGYDCALQIMLSVCPIRARATCNSSARLTCGATLPTGSNWCIEFEKNMEMLRLEPHGYEK